MKDKAPLLTELKLIRTHLENAWKFQQLKSRFLEFAGELKIT